ncbi:MAG: FecR family protein [bacterium]|nr:FecR family protein [bacterium]
MKPEKVEELIQNHLDMSLSSEQKSLLENYLETHAESRIDLERYKKILGLLDAEEELEPPENFTENVMAQLPAVKFKRVNRGGYGSIFENFSPIVGAIGVALAAVFVFAVTNMDSPFFKADDVFRPQGQIVDVADRPGSLDNSDVPHNLVDQKYVHPKMVDGPVKMAIHAIDGLVFIGTDPKRLKFINSGGSEVLKAGHIIRTIGNAKIAYVGDDTEIKLKPKTELRVIDHENFHLKHGDVWVEIRKKVDHFEIKTDHLVAAVRGTIFSVSANTIDWNTVTTSRTGAVGASSGVQVFEGNVEVRQSRGDKSVESLQRGEGVIFKESSPKLESLKLAEEDYQRWGQIMPSEGSSETIILNDETGPSNSFDQEVE